MKRPAVLIRLALSLVILPASVAADVSSEAPAELAAAPVPSAEDLLGMVARLPLWEAGPDRQKPGHWDKAKEAPRVAEAIHDAMLKDPDGPVFENWRVDGGLMFTYAVYESQLRPDAVGDGGKSLGVVQLQNFPPEVAFDPELAMGWWRRKAHLAVSQCKALAGTDARIAALGSGRCTAGLALAKRRVGLARLIVAGP